MLFLSGTGQAVSKDNAGAEPTISIVGTDASFAAGGAFNTTTKYTLMMIDGDYAGAANPDGVNAHYLQNDLSSLILARILVFPC